MNQLCEYDIQYPITIFYDDKFTACMEYFIRPLNDDCHGECVCNNSTELEQHFNVFQRINPKYTALNLASVVACGNVFYFNYMGNAIFLKKLYAQLEQLVFDDMVAQFK